MKAHTSEFKEQIKTLGRELDSIISFNGTELSVEELNSVTPHYEGGLLKSVMKQLDIDSNVEINVGDVVNYKLGIKVNDEYEYLNFGNYIVNKVEKQEDFNSYMITCYDKMLYSMKDYEKLNISYPISIRDYITAICNHLGINFKNKNESFANYDKMIQNELYLDENDNSLGYTFRDVFDELAQATASTICINDNDELEIRYINDTQDTIDEEFLRDINVNFGEKYGPINSIVLSRSAGSDNVYLRDETSVSENGLTELKISDNQIMNWNDRSDYLPDILEKINGLEYYLNDFVSTGVCYYELCDKYNVKIGDNIYSCIMLNDEINVTQGLVEEIFTEKLEISETDYTKSDKTDRKINQTYLIVDKQNGVIQGVVEKTEQIEQDITTTKQANGNPIIVEDAGAYLLESIEIEGKSIQDGISTPDAPVEIKTVKGVRNWFDINNLKLHTISGATVEVKNNVYKITNTTDYMNGYARYFLFDTQDAKGKTFTLSTKALSSGNNLARINILLSDDAGENRSAIGNTNSTKDGILSATFTIPKELTTTQTKLLVLFYSSYNIANVNGTYIEYSDIQIEEGSIIHNCVPYGRWLEIKNTNKDGTKENTALIDMNKINKFNYKNVLDGVSINSSGLIYEYTNSKVNYIEVKEGKTYTLVSDYQRQFVYSYYSNIPTLGSQGATRIVKSNIKSLTLTIPSGYKYLAIRNYIDSATTEDNTNLKIYEGLETDDYYRFASIGDVKDTFKNGVLTQRIGKVVLDNAGNWYVNGNHYQLTFYTNLDVLKGKIPMSNYFKGVLYSSNELGISLTQSDNISYLRINNASSVFSSLSEFKTWLGENLVEVYYELATPIEHNLHYQILELHEGYNNITLNDELEPNMNIEYLVDSKLNSQYATKSELKIETDSIKQSVSAEIDELDKKTEASLELKVNRDNLASEINAIADFIKLVSNELVIETDKFKLAEGVMEAVGGKIGNFEINENGLSFLIVPKKEYTQEDFDNVGKYLVGLIDLTEEEKYLLDASNDGEIKSNDTTFIYYFMKYGITPENPGKFEIVVPKANEPFTKAKIGFFDGNGELINGFDYKKGVFEEVNAEEVNAKELYVKGKSLLYNIGNVFNVYRTTPCAGHLTGGSKNIEFSLILPKIMADEITGATINSFNFTIRNADGGYIMNGTTFDGTINVFKATDNILLVQMLGNTAFNFTNNTPVTVSVNAIDLTFN